VRAAVWTGTGLQVSEVPVPSPGHGEVLVEVHAVSASRLELEQTMTGRGLGAVVRPPRVLGMDPSGVIVAAGPGAGQRRVGERVAVKPNLVCGVCAWCKNDGEADCPDQGVLGAHRDGGAAEFVTVPAVLAFPLADGLGFEQASAAVHSASVALHMLRTAGVGAGDAVLVLGASGAVGSAATQLAAHLGAQVVTEGPVRAVIDTTGDGRLLSAAMDQLGWKGTAVTCAGRGIPATVDLAALYRDRRTLAGVAASDFGDVRDALALAAAGAVSPRPAPSA
jgi:NADPH:quinone reductase-like Zn-dependent oxidoreductase